MTYLTPIFYTLNLKVDEIYDKSTFYKSDI